MESGSISDSGYYADSDRQGARASNPFYRGELSEFDVLGMIPKVSVTEADIQKAFTAKTRITVPKGSSIMLIQSGAMIPDDVMVKGLEKYYDVSVLTGVPGKGELRKMAMQWRFGLLRAKGGYEKMLVIGGYLKPVGRTWQQRSYRGCPLSVGHCRTRLSECVSG